MSLPTVNPAAAGTFLLTAIALLGSPGPGIAALLAIGRERGFAGGLRYFAGLQLGLAATAALSALGVFSLLLLLPGVGLALTLASSAYLLWLAWRIGSAVPGGGGAAVPARFGAGLFLGLSNPKAYLAFALLFALRPVVVGAPAADAAGKWALIVLVILAVDLVWLAIGAGLHRASLRPRAERALNLGLAATIVLATVLTLRV